MVAVPALLGLLEALSYLLALRLALPPDPPLHVLPPMALVLSLPLVARGEGVVPILRLASLSLSTALRPANPNVLVDVDVDVLDVHDVLRGAVQDDLRPVEEAA